MKSNFDFLQRFNNLAEVYKAAKVAELNWQIDSSACCLLCRRASEYALRHIYASDDKLRIIFSEPQEEDFFKLILCSGFDSATIGYLSTIRKNGNDAAHKPSKKLSKRDATKSLNEMHFFFRSQYLLGAASCEQMEGFDPLLIPGYQGKIISETKSDNNAKIGFTKYIISSRFNEALAHLPEHIQKMVAKRLEYLQKSKKLPDNRRRVMDAVNDGIYLLSIDVYYDLLVFLENDACVLLYVDTTERAKAVAKGMFVQVNMETGTIQSYNTTSTTIQCGEPNNVAYSENLFLSYDSDDLLRLGVPQEQLCAVLMVKTLAEWEVLCTQLPADAAYALTALLHGASVESVYKEIYRGNKQVEENDFVSAAQNPMLGSSVIDDSCDIARMFDAPLEKWRVYLHPQQRRIAYRCYAGAVRVLGGAGTGKSVVALHHAKYLAKEYGANKRILFTSFTKMLMQDIRNRLHSICTDDEYSRIQIIHYDGLLQRLLRDFNCELTLIYGEKELNDIWLKAIRACRIDDEYTPEFLRDEWCYIVQAQDLHTKEDYFTAERKGRGKRIDRDARATLWSVFCEYVRLMKARKWIDAEWAANYICQKLSEEPQRRYDSIIIDESPDFGPCQFRLLRTLAGAPHEDDLFITGDPRQRIYTTKPKVILSRCGINVRGRSLSLTVNYRTTAKVLKWANRLLDGIQYDDLDEGVDDSGNSFSLIEGEQPQMQYYDQLKDECNAVASQIKHQIDSGISPSSIAVITRIRIYGNMICDALSRLGVCAGEPDRLEHLGGEFVHCLSMHKSKGLEYDYVYLPCLREDTLPLPRALRGLSGEALEEKINTEKQLLHVAITRARKNVFLSGSGRPSVFLELLKQ